MVRRHPVRAYSSSSVCAFVACIVLCACGGAGSTIPSPLGRATNSIRQSAVRPQASNTWSTGASDPTKRFFASAAVVGTEIYVIGGYNFGGPLGQNDIFDTATGTWSTGAAMPMHRFGLASAVMDGIVYA